MLSVACVCLVCDFDGCSGAFVTVIVCAWSCERRALVGVFVLCVVCCGVCDFVCVCDVLELALWRRGSVLGS